MKNEKVRQRNELPCELDFTFCRLLQGITPLRGYTSSVTFGDSFPSRGSLKLIPNRG